MAWSDFLNKDLRAYLSEKLNPAQEDIVWSLEGAGPIGTREIPTNYTTYYEWLEVVNRGVNMIVDDTAEISLKVGGQIEGGFKPIVKNVRRSRVDLLLNKEPNPFQDISSFRRNLIIDYILDGNIFIYFDGTALYHLPASFMEIIPDTETYVKGYSFNAGGMDQTRKMFSTSEIIHIKENSFQSIYRGTSRLRAARRIMAQLVKMREFQDNFFKNGAVPGLVIKHPSTLSQKIKDRMTAYWAMKFRPDGGGRTPMILDGGMEVDKLSDTNFRELDFELSIKNAEQEILTVLGIPPILLDGGNNANIRPNHRLYYLETIMPIVEKIDRAFERFFGYELVPDITGIPALQPELRDAATFYTGLVNGGIITPNEARTELNFPCLDEDCDQIRVPQNIAGSASDPTQGGRPEETNDPNNEQDGAG